MSSNIAVHRSSSPVLTRLRSFADTLKAYAHDLAAARRAAAEYDRLIHLSDAALARKGLTRDKVVRHAFRNYLR